VLPTLVGPRVTLRPATAADVPPMALIRAEPAIVTWWDDPEPASDAATLLGHEAGTEAFVIEVDAAVVGQIQFFEQPEEAFRHAGIDVFLTGRLHGQGIGREAIGLLAVWLLDVRGHRRLTIDPAAANVAAIRCYAAVGFRPVGTLRQYQRLHDGRLLDGLLMELVRDDLRASA
jgi:aminoglycoside 6'-N-acetyltransferase